jgi:tol-pal system protein YbgF
MRHSLIILVFLLLAPAAARGQNREHLQMAADLQMLEERVNRLQLSVNRLDEGLDATNKRVDAAAAASVKGFADQQLLINQLAATLTTVRERLDDNSVRVSQLSQEFMAIREGVRRLTEQINTLVGLLQPPVAPGATPAADATPGTSTAPGGPGSEPDGQTAQALTPVVLPQSASYVYKQAFGDYMAQRYESAIEGFREVIRDYPDAPDAATAQFQIGEAYYQNKDCRSAIPEFRKFVETYKDSERRPDGLYDLGLCYVDLKQLTNAQRAFEQVIREHPDSTAAMMATQRLQGMGIKPQ